MMRRKWFLFAPLAMLGIVLVGFLAGQLVMALWNALLPNLFGWPVVTFWQALGILALCRILFGGFGRHGSRRYSGRHWGVHDRVGDRVAERFAERMGERWDAMTPEERERFRERMRF
jgi:hypothetical protein